MSPDEEARDLLAKVIRIEVMLETELRSFKSVINDHEARIRQGERWRYALPISAFAAIASCIVAIVSALGR